MPAAPDAPPPLSRAPWIALLTRIAEETEIDGSVRVAGELLAVPRGHRLMVAALADALHARYFRARTSTTPFLTPLRAKSRGAEACARLAEALRPQFLGRDGWTFTYRHEGGVPVFVMTAGDRSARAAASCFLDLAPGVAPEVFARLVTALDGYGLPFRAELRGDPAIPERVGTAVVTVARGDAAALARVALRLRQRSPFVFGQAVPAFTRPVAPGISLADEPGEGADFGRHRCRLIAAALVAAGPGAGPVERRAAVLRALKDAAIDPLALHLNPGNPEFRLAR